MRNLRLIPRLDVKQNWLIKGVQMEGWRKVGSPAEFAKRYADAGADELLFMDVVASLYGRNNLQDIVRKVAESVFIPLTVGGGVRSLSDVSDLLSNGADKVAINTAATLNPNLVRHISDEFGSQATVVVIECAYLGNNNWEAMTDNGRNHTGLNALDWAKRVEQLGAGEIIVTSINNDGTGKGYDLPLLQAISESVNVPVVASGGFGKIDHIKSLCMDTQVSAASVAQALHWNKVEIATLRNALEECGIYVRPLP